jgi:hypothetical protein
MISAPHHSVGLRQLVEAEGNPYRIAVRPKVVMKDLVHGVARESGIDLPGHWNPRIILSTWDVCRYQEGGIVRLFAATQETLEAVWGPRTAKGSIAKIPKAIECPQTPKPRKSSKTKRDWIGELKARGEVEETDPQTFSSQIQMDKMIALTTDGGARPARDQLDEECLCLKMDTSYACGSTTTGPRTMSWSWKR